MPLSGKMTMAEKLNKKARSGLSNRLQDNTFVITKLFLIKASGTSLEDLEIDEYKE